MVGQHVTWSFLRMRSANMSFPMTLQTFLKEYYRLNGVELLTGESVVSVQKEGNHILAHTGSGRVMEVDGVVAGIGIRPNLDLANKPVWKPITESL